MRIFLLTVLLTFSAGVFAIPHNPFIDPQNIHKLPFHGIGVSDPTNRLTEHNRTICIVRARVGAESLKNAKAGVSLQESRARLSKIIFSKRFEKLNLPIDENAELSKILDFAYKVHEKHPSVTPNQLGDRIWESCVYEKTAILV